MKPAKDGTTRKEGSAKAHVKNMAAIYSTWRWQHPVKDRPPVNVITEGTMIGPRKTVWGPGIVRDGRLGAGERHAFLLACRAIAAELGPIQGTTVDAIEFIYLTGLRKSEAAGLRWDEIHDDGWLRIAAERVKSRKPIIRPITKGMQSILNRRAEVANGSPYVFPSWYGNRAGEPINPDIRSSLKLVNTRAGTAITPHDLRRTFSSAGRDAGFDNDTIGLFLGHANRNVTAGYVGLMRDTLPAIAARIEVKLTEKPRTETNGKAA
jgi:integrase